MQTAKKIIFILLSLVAITCVIAIFSIKQFKSLRYLDTVEKWCKEYEVDVYVVLATIEVESGGEVMSTSHRGAMGLMQLMPNTAEWLADRLGVEVTDYYDVDSNIMLGVAYLDYLSERFDGDWVYCAYNAGEGVVREWIREDRGIVYSETKIYVEKINKIMRNLKEYRYLY